MPITPKTFQGLRNLFKPAETAISTVPEIKGALTTISESPQANSMLEAVMNKDMSRREFMKRSAASTANQAVPKAIQSLVTKELAKEALPSNIKVATENQLLKNLTDVDPEEFEGMGALEYYLGTMSPELKTHLWDQYQFGLHPSNSKLLYDPNKLPGVQKVIDDIMGENRGVWDKFKLTSDEDVDYSGTYVDNILRGLKNMNLSPEEKAIKKLQDKRDFLWDRISFSQNPQKLPAMDDLKSWVSDLNTPDQDIKNWVEGIKKGYIDKYRELNQSALENPDLEITTRLIGPKLPKGVVDFRQGVDNTPGVNLYKEYPNQGYEIGDYLQDYLKGMEP